MKSITEIKAEFEQTECGQRFSLYEMYASDTRKGVQNLIKKYQKEEVALEAERMRLEQMKEFEKKFGNKYEFICGVDEAGRGPLAGPVVAGACILPRDAEILYLNDSKKLSAKKRDELYDEIREKAVAYGIGVASPQRIDEINILQATYEAMQQAIEQMTQTPDLLLVDAVTIPKVSMKQVGIIKGDARSVSIAAASILAKVARDRMMQEFDVVYPEYGFAKHKGYGSVAHIQAIKEYGPSPIHRSTFIKNFVE